MQRRLRARALSLPDTPTLHTLRPHRPVEECPCTRLPADLLAALQAALALSTNHELALLATAPFGHIRGPRLTQVRRAAGARLLYSSSTQA